MDLKLSEDLKNQLCKSLAGLKLFLKYFKEMEVQCKPCIDYLMNLTEQYQCCDKVDPILLPKKVDFPDVKEQLLYKISVTMTRQIEAVQEQLVQLEAHSTRLGKYYDYCMSFYQRDCGVEDIEHLMQRSATSPSVADMLEWMEESSRLVRERYLCKRHLVDNFFPDDPQLCDTFVRQWREGDTDMINTIEEYTAMSKGFLEESVT